MNTVEPKTPPRIAPVWLCEEECPGSLLWWLSSSSSLAAQGETAHLQAQQSVSRLCLPLLGTGYMKSAHKHMNVFEIH